MLPHFPLLDLFFRTVLMATSQFVVIFIILTGYIFLKRNAFSRPFFIFAFAMILNPFLKSLFQIPPSNPNLDGWSFPSGHMLTATIFWGWLAWEYKNSYFYIFTTLFLSCYGIALIYFGYHYPSDVIGAIFFALLTLFLYNLLLKLPILKNTPPLAGFLLAIPSILILFFIPENTAKSHIWVGLGSLLGFACGWLISNKFSALPHLSLKIKLFIFLVSILGLIILNSIFTKINSKLFLTIAIYYFIVALWLTAIAQIIILKFVNKNPYSKIQFN